MSVSLGQDGNIQLAGEVSAADAEPLLQLLYVSPEAAIDWRDCVACHTAVVQVILASRRRLSGPPAGAALKRWILESA